MPGTSESHDMVLGGSTSSVRSFSEDGFSPGSWEKRRAGVLLEDVRGPVSAQLERPPGTPRNSTRAGEGGSSGATAMHCAQKLGSGVQPQASERHLYQRHPGRPECSGPEA